MFQMRTSLPERGSKYYNTTSAGGYSKNIKGKCKSTGKPCNGLNVLANCTGYANGRFAEIIGKKKIEYQLTCNAENFIEAAKKMGLKISKKPTLGGIMVFQKGATLKKSDGAGHVMVVEKIIDDNTVYTSESGYNSTTFWNSTRKNNNGRWGMGKDYKYRGCIINPAVKDEKIPYQVYDNKTKKWLPKVNIGSKDYAGNLGDAIGGIRVYDGYEYRVHIKGGYWLEWVKKADDTPNGYAGIYGKEIDGVQIKNASYRVHIKNGKWLDWVNKVDDTSTGYAGIYGKPIDAIQIK